jgi:hypothetical protein
MKKILFALILTQFSLTLYAENPQICEVKIKKKSFEGIELCQKDDILIIYAGGSSKKEIIARTVAQICNIETIRTIGDFVPNIHTCSYSGKTLNIRG